MAGGKNLPMNSLRENKNTFVHCAKTYTYQYAHSYFSLLSYIYKYAYKYTRLKICVNTQASHLYLETWKIAVKKALAGCWSQETSFICIAQLDSQWQRCEVNIHACACVCAREREFLWSSAVNHSVTFRYVIMILDW